MSTVPPERPNWAAPLLLLAAVLLAAGLAFNLANLDTGGEAVPALPNAGGTDTSNTGLLDPGTFQTGFVILFFLLGVAGMILLRRRRRVRMVGPHKPLSYWDLLGSMIGAALFFGLLLLWPHIVRAMRPGPPDPGQTANGTEAMTALPTISGLPAGLFLAGALAVALVILVWFLQLGKLLHRDAGVEPSRETRRAAADAVAATIQELELGGDVRTAILACFDRFCRLLGERGFRDQASLTPRELESLAVRGLRVPEESAEALTSLFEEARYSEHPLGESDRERAVESLRRIRSSLEA